MSQPIPVQTEPAPVDTPAAHIPKAFRLDAFCSAGLTHLFNLKEPGVKDPDAPTFIAAARACWDHHRQAAEVSVEVWGTATSLRVSLPSLSPADARDLADALLKAADVAEAFEKRAAELRLS